MVIASDGLWDVLNERDLLSVRTNSSQEIATELVTRAITGGSRDNVAVVVICFN